MAALVILLVACGGEPTLPGNAAIVLRAAPVLAGKTLDGGRISLGSARDAVVVVNFFNPFCLPCAEEASALRSAWRDLRPRGVRFFGVHYTGGNWPPGTRPARRFLRRNGLRYPVLEDPGRRLAEGFRIRGIPTTIVVDSRGRERFEITGPVHPGEIQDLVSRL